MRALLVGAAAVEGSQQLLASIAAEHDLVVAIDAGGTLCMQAGVRPDIVVGDFDSIDPADLASLRTSGSRIVTFPADKNETDFELAIAVARHEGATAVTVTAAAGLRLDHTLGVMSVLVGAADLSPTLIDPDTTLWVLGREGREALDVSGNDATFSLVPWGGSAVVSATGVKWPLAHETLSTTTARGISNVIVAAGARVEVHVGSVLVIAPALAGAVRLCAE